MKKPERTLESQYPARLLSVAAVLTVITLAWLGWNAFNSYHLTKAMRNHVVKVEELRGTILHLDEVLTMSARMAAATNDLRWEVRYLEFAPQLDEAIAEAKQLSPEAGLSKGAAQTDAANIQLVKMENQAFKLVRLGRLHEAQALLKSEAYETQKRLYAQGLASFVGTLRAGANAVLETQQHKALFNIVVVLAVLPMLAVAWTVTLRTLNTWRDALSERNRLLTTQAVELTRAREEADRANQAKSEFLSRMSHELRTPLNAVLGFAQLLEMGTLTPAQQGQVKHILKGGRHLLDLINEVLDISRIEAGTLALSLEPCAVRDILLETTDLVRPMAADWRIRIDDGAMRQCRAFVVADHQRLKQVLLNLLSNAVKYNRHDGQIRLSYEERPEGRLRMCVQDTGPGIPAERMGRLFTLFDRLGAENSKIEGTGLGLALSARLIEAMNGSIGADSSVGVGTTFWIELPTTKLPSGAAMNEMIWNGARDPESRGQAARKILYIEDNLTNVSLMEAILEHRPDIELMTSMQGRLGLDLAREHPPHAIFLDLHLPDMSGLDVLSRLRAEPTTRKTPVIVFTADATPGLAERTLATGAHAFFTKPLDARKLVQIVEELLPAPHGQATQVVP